MRFWWAVQGSNLRPPACKLRELVFEPFSVVYYCVEFANEYDGLRALFSLNRDAPITGGPPWYFPRYELTGRIAQADSRRGVRKITPTWATQ